MMMALSDLQIQIKIVAYLVKTIQLMLQMLLVEVVYSV